MDPSKRKQLNFLITRRSSIPVPLKAFPFIIPCAFAFVVLATLLALSPPALTSRFQSDSEVITVISTAGTDSVSRKLRLVLEETLPTDYFKLRPIILNREEQREYVKSNNCGLKRFNELIKRHQENLSVELFKYCILSKQKGDAAYVDASSPLLVGMDEILQKPTSIAVVDNSHFLETIHGSLLVLRKDQIYIAQEMLQHVVNSPIEVLEASPPFLQRNLYKLIAGDARSTSAAEDVTLTPGITGDRWFLFEQKCRMNPLRRMEGSNTDSKKLLSRPAKSEYSCSVRDVTKKLVVMMSRQPVLIHQRITGEMQQPYDATVGFFAEDELPYISTVREKVFLRPADMKETPNLYEIFYDRDKMPAKKCFRCLHFKSCEKEHRYCAEYFHDLCAEAPKTKFVSKEVTITPPMYRRDPSRLIPRIVHQTWFETLDKERYPNMSRLVESWKRSGWEYKFYSDEDAEMFLRTHFPPEVLEAYQSLLPGAFKADLFRYCALLIHGGVYADVDIMLESSLDVVVEPDIGFMVPMDEPEGCVWQGLIGASPGHPFLSLAVQTVVNQVRNKFTSIDIDASFCPNPKYKVLHTFDVLFTAGPCLLGASINRALGRPGQELFKPGDLLPRWNVRDSNNTLTENIQRVNIPGRTVILKQNKNDMGAHRFTFESTNMIVAATDLENADDRQNWPKASTKKYAEPFGGAEDEADEEEEEEKAEGAAHYSNAHARTGIYGIEGLYVNHELVDEDIRLFIDDSRQIRMTALIESRDSTALL